MSGLKPLQTVTQLAEARRAAAACEHLDIHSTVQQCPASQGQLFVVPVRYALSEEPANHAAFQPGVITQSHPMAARTLRVGFVYVWQGNGPLQRYAVAENALLRQQALDEEDTVVVVGTLSGIALDKHQSAWMLYSEIPLNPQHCEHLNDPEVRAKRMRCLDLRTVANTLQAPHCVPLQDAAKVIGELIPKTYNLSLAMDFQRNQAAYRKGADELGEQVFKKPTPVIIKAYTDALRWVNEREQVAANHPPFSEDATPPGEWSAQTWAPTASKTLMETAHEQSSGLYSVLACLDDDLGVLRDINHEQELVESRHEQWQADNSLRLSIGGFVRSLITEDGAELSGQLNYRYREHNLVLTEDQGKAMLAAHHRLDELFKEESNINQARGGYYSHKQANALLHKVHAEVKATVAPLRSFIPPQLHTEIEAVVRDYRDDKIANLENRHASDKVEEYIDLSAMNTWLDTTAPAHFSHTQQRHESLFSDRGLYLQRHHSATWQVDYNDPDHTHWLDTLAVACLSGQCIRAQGAEQYADYVRSADEGALRQLFYSWSPTLEAAVNSNTRASELIAALALENQANAQQALATVLGPKGLNMLADLKVMAGDINSVWNLLVKRLSASLLLLRSKAGEPFQGAWLAIMTALRAASEMGLRLVHQGERQLLQLVGKAAEDLTQWSITTGRAIGAGRVADIVNSTAVKNSGGLIAVAALLLNSWNASHYLSEAGVLEEMDEQRENDTWSASLYAGAALIAVIDSQMRRTFEITRLGKGLTTVPVLTVFGALIGSLSAAAAFKEFNSLKNQLESAHTTIDPWFQARFTVVTAQVMVFGIQAINGAVFTARALAGKISIEAAILKFAVWMGPLNYLIAVLGVLYLVAWYFQQTPMQNFLSGCCWGRSRARDFNPTSLSEQQIELNRLYEILYAPRISFESTELNSVMSSLQTGNVNVLIKSLTIDLPGAEPASTYLDIAMIGDPLDTPAMFDRIKKGEGRFAVAEPMQDITEHWLRSCKCEWIPYKQGQGLRLTGPFLTVPGQFGSPPDTVSLRVRYRPPLTSIQGGQSFIGGERGVAFLVNIGTGVIALRNDPTPMLDKAQRYSLGAQELKPVINQ